MKKQREKKQREKKTRGGDRRRPLGSVLMDYLFCAAGAFLYALGVVYFINPVKFVPGGVTTLGILVNYLLPVVPIGVFVFAVNVPLFIASWRVFGSSFIAKTVISTALLSVFIDLLTALSEKNGWVYEGDEKLVAAIFGGVCLGAGVGIVFSRGGTTGGMDIVARLLRLKFPHISIGRLVLLCDFIVVVLAGVLYKSVNSVLYSGIVILISGVTVDFVVSGRSNSKMLMIMTDHADEITKAITTAAGRGVSVLSAKGGYTGEEHKMLLCVVRAHEVAEIRRLVQQYDEHPFIIITDSGEVLGEGFKSHKDTL